MPWYWAPSRSQQVCVHVEWSPVILVTEAVRRMMSSIRACVLDGF